MKIDLDRIKKKKSMKELLEFSIINLDKPTGPTSFAVSQFVKKALSLSKTSHLGTLDPMVTGVLPVALNRACRLNEYLMHRDKEYIGIMRLHKEDVLDSVLKAEMKKLVGRIKQLPPKRSAVKRAVRVREVKRFEIIERDGQDVLFIADVEAGTYIRTLCHDLGKHIGGAHMRELRRSKAGFFSELDASFVNLYDFEKAVEAYNNGEEKLLRNILVPGEVVSNLLPIIKVKKDVVKKLYTGSPIFPTFLEEKPSSVLKQGDKVSAFADDVFIGCYKYIGAENLVAKAEFVKN